MEIETLKVDQFSPPPMGPFEDLATQGRELVDLGRDFYSRPMAHCAVFQGTRPQGSVSDLSGLDYRA